MNKILIIVPRFVPYSNRSSYVFPLGLAYISASLKKAGYPVDILNLNYYEDAQSELLNKKLRQQKYDYVLTGALSHHYRIIKNLTVDIRRADQDVVLIVGGGIISASPELMFNQLKPDYIVIGEGELTIVELIAFLDRGGDLQQIAGIGYQNDEGKLVITAPRKLIKDIDTIPFPDLAGFDIETFLNMQRPNDNIFTYINDTPRIIPVISSRGCPYRCTFCYHPIGRQYRSRSVDNFMQEVSSLVARYKVNNLAITDELLSANRDRLIDICNRLIQMPERINWMCQLRVDSVDEEMLALMREAGCYLVSYGFESANNGILRSMQKNITRAQIEKALCITRKAGINTQANFIFGDTAETLETARDTLRFWKTYQDYHLTLGYVRPYPGSILWDKAVAKGSLQLADELLHLIDLCVSAPPNISLMDPDEWFGFQKEAFKAMLMNPHYGKPVTSTRQKDGDYTITIECPYCRQESIYRNFHQRILGVFKIACRQCNQTMNMSPLVFEHVRQDYDRNLAVYQKILKESVPVTVTPCMSEAEFAAMADIALSGCNIINFMDIDPDKSPAAYQHRPVLERNQENIEALGVDNYFLIPLTRYADRIFKHLKSLGVTAEKICRLDAVIVGPDFSDNVC